MSSDERICGKCRHWTPPSERTGWGSAVGVDDAADDFSDEGFDAREQAQDEADKRMGECSGVPGNPTVSELPSPAASVRDGSGYLAQLYTAADFGCVLFAERSSSRVGGTQ